MEVLKLYIHVNGCEKVKSECATVQMISFDGKSMEIISEERSSGRCGCRFIKDQYRYRLVI